MAALQGDGRRAFADVASELGVSEGTIRQRYRRLVAAGILQVVAVADPFKVGYGTMTMIGVKVSLDGERSIDAVGAEIAAFPEVSYAVVTALGVAGSFAVGHLLAHLPGVRRIV